MKKPRGLEMFYILIWLVIAWEYKYPEILLNCTHKICIAYVCHKLFYYVYIGKIKIHGSLFPES